MKKLTKEEKIDAAALARLGIDPALAGIQIASDRTPEPDFETVCEKLNVTPEEFARFVAAESEKMRRLVQASGARVD